MFQIIFSLITVITIIIPINIIAERETDVGNGIVGVHMEGMVDVHNTRARSKNRGR
jgi:hypothetical protein